MVDPERHRMSSPRKERRIETKERFVRLTYEFLKLRLGCLTPSSVKLYRAQAGLMDRITGRST